MAELGQILVGATNYTNTDTKNTAGSTDTSSKIFLVGATSQAANPQTYSQDTAYVGTDGCLYSGGTKVLTAHQDISGKADKATTLAGYGITDAKIVSGTIVLGSDNITPLTSSSTLDATKLSGTIPSECYTDTNVTQTHVSSDNYYRSLLFSSESAASSTNTGTVLKSNYVRGTLDGDLYLSNANNYTTKLSPKYIKIGEHTSYGSLWMGVNNATLEYDITLSGSNQTWDGTNTSLKTAVTAAKGTVTQTPTDSTNSTYELLFSDTADNTEHTEGARKTQYLKYNPSDMQLTVNDKLLVSTFEDVETIPQIQIFQNKNSKSLTVTSTDITLDNASHDSTWDGTNTSLKTAISAVNSKVNNLDERLSLDIADFYGNQATVASGTSVKNIGSFKNTTAGRYMIIVSVIWSGNANGYRVAYLSDTSTGTNIDRFAVDSRMAVNGEQTVQGFSEIIWMSANTTYYITGKQNSGSSLTAYWGVKALRIPH